jgi:aerobic carbon-monoxide dehydrogenase medium subunit
VDAFEFAAPATLDEALAELAAPEAVVLAGGTSLVLLLKSRLIAPRRVVWLGKVGGLRGIEVSAGDLVIGAMTTLAEVAASREVGRLLPALAQAARVVGNPRVRAVATVGGALAHADPRQDLPPALLALGAVVRLQSPAGERRLPLRTLFTGPLETSLRDGELLTAVEVPAPPAGQRSLYLRFTPASREDFPTVGVAVRVVNRDGVVVDAALALAGVAPVPLLVPQAAEALRQAGPAAVAELAERACDPSDDQRGSASYKPAMAGVWSRRALAAALA